MFRPRSLRTRSLLQGLHHFILFSLITLILSHLEGAVSSSSIWSSNQSYLTSSSSSLPVYNYTYGTYSHSLLANKVVAQFSTSGDCSSTWGFSVISSSSKIIEVSVSISFDLFALYSGDLDIFDEGWGARAT